MAEWIIAGLLGAILLILYVELRVLIREMEKLDRRMERCMDRVAEDVRALRRIVEGEGT